MCNFYNIINSSHKELRTLLSVLNKISENIALSQDFNIYKGMMTKKNEAFIIENKDIKLNNLEQELIKPILKGENIEKYNIDYKEKSVICATWKEEDSNKIYLDKKKYKNTYEYLLKFEEKNKSKQLYDIKLPKNESNGNFRKIVGKNKTYILKFSIEEKGYLGIDTVINIKSKSNIDDNLEYICAILNSKLINVYYRFFSMLLLYDEGNINLDIIKNIPIPKANDYDIDIIKKYVIDNIECNNNKNAIKMNLSNKETINLKNEEELLNKKIETNIEKLDKLIFKIFELNENEIKVVNKYYDKLVKKSKKYKG